jgi:hypothetical protein
MDTVEPPKHLLDKELGLSISVGGRERRRFFNGQGDRFAVDNCCE